MAYTEKLTEYEIKYGFHHVMGFYKHWVGYDLQTFILDLGISNEDWQLIKNCKECDFDIMHENFIKRIDEILKQRIL